MDLLRTRAVYDVLLHAARGLSVPPVTVDRAASATVRLWWRALRIEQCAPAVERGLRAGGGLEALPAGIRALLRETAATALRNALLIPGQLERIARLAAEHGITVIALKGAARLLAGEPPGARSVGDIDVLVHARDAPRLHALLARELACTVGAPGPAHHLPVLTPRSGVPVEVHVRLSDGDSPLDEAIWREARATGCGDATILVPGATLRALHTLDHAVLTHWGMRYRLRDVLDVASAMSEDVDIERVVAHVRASHARRAMETLLCAAATLEPRIPAGDPSAWRTIARVGRTRLAASFLSRRWRQAERILTVSSVVSEGSPEGLRRLADLVARRTRARIAAIGVAGIATLSATGCSEVNGPPRAPEIPTFIFASEAEGALALYRYESGVVTRHGSLGAGDDEPHAAGGHLVFSSGRDGNREIYFDALDGSPPRRLTTHASTDGEPSLRHDAEMVAFVSSRSGTPRIWIVDMLGGAPAPLVTGSPSFIPERAPMWSPAGDRIAFTSTRTGTSQVWVVSAAGGTAAQVTHESGGAFDPTWSADGSRIHYSALGAVSRAMTVVLASGATSIAGEDPEGVGQPACTAELCLAVRRPYAGDGDIVAYHASGAGPYDVVVRAGADRGPTLLSP